MPIGLQGQLQWFQEKKRRNKNILVDLIFRFIKRSGEPLKHQNEAAAAATLPIKILQYQDFMMMFQVLDGEMPLSMPF